MNSSMVTPLRVRLKRASVSRSWPWRDLELGDGHGAAGLELRQRDRALGVVADVEPDVGLAADAVAADPVELDAGEVDGWRAASDRR